MVMKSLLILGRQPALGLAELESLFGAEAIIPVGTEAALLAIEAKDVPFARLGGSVKLARVLTELDTTQWKDVEQFLGEVIPEHLQYVPEGKFRLGLSAYGLKVRPQEINATGLRLKKVIKAAGRSVRIVPNKSAALNSAQVLHNQLTNPNGWELLAVRNDSKIILAQTYAEQDIEAYAKRDQNRPMRDAKVGMLPPKLAQIIINLTNPGPGQILLDPFCGTGVVLQEALLMGYEVYGTDIDKRMIEYSAKNLKWLSTQHSALGTQYSVEVGDATSHQWDNFDAVAGETYLGKPLSTLPPRHILEPIIKECDEIHQKFLANIAKQLAPGARLCLAVPAWKTKTGFLHLKTLDYLVDLGYNRGSFVHASTEDLVYHRPDQTVARELVILEKS